MKGIIFEVGSTCTKIDEYDGKKIKHLGTIPIEFKKHYYENNCLKEEDVSSVIELVNEYKSKNNVLVYGTSIFRQLNQDERNNFLDKFKNKTGIEFSIISQEKENEYTVKGVTSKVKEALVFIGGGGSTEISYYNNGIKEMKNNKFGVMDVLRKFPDLANDYATTSIDEVMEFIDERIEVPKIKTDIMILAGGGHEYFARESGISYEKNTLYNDINAPIMMSIDRRISDSHKYYTEISLDNIRKKVEEPAWWYATRAMCAFVLVVAKRIGAKYIIPTDVSMIYGILEN